MGMGLLGALGGLGQAGEKIGEQMVKAEDQRSLKQYELEFLAKERERVEQVKEAKDKAKRELFVTEMDSMRTAKLGENAGNLNQAAEIYRTADGLSDADRQAGLGAVDQARTRLGKLSPEEVGMAGLKTGNLEAKDYITATSRQETATDKLTNAVLLKQLGIDATQQNVQTKETGKNERLDKSLVSREGIAADKIESNETIAANKVGQLTGSQRVMNKEIDAARRIVGSLEPGEIKKKTAKFTNTGRDNPDYDAGLAKRVSIAAKRKYGDDDWFDTQNGLTGEETEAQPHNKGTDVTTRFGSDPDMKAFKMGKQTEKGLEVLDANGKLIGHYR